MNKICHWIQVARFFFSPEVKWGDCCTAFKWPLALAHYKAPWPSSRCSVTFCSCYILSPSTRPQWNTNTVNLFIMNLMLRWNCLPGNNTWLRSRRVIIDDNLAVFCFVGSGVGTGDRESARGSDDGTITLVWRFTVAICRQTFDIFIHCFLVLTFSVKILL